MAEIDEQLAEIMRAGQLSRSKWSGRLGRLISLTAEGTWNEYSDEFGRIAHDARDELSRSLHEDGEVDADGEIVGDQKPDNAPPQPEDESRNSVAGIS